MKTNTAPSKILFLSPNLSNVQNKKDFFVYYSKNKKRKHSIFLYQIIILKFSKRQKIYSILFFKFIFVFPTFFL